MRREVYMDGKPPRLEVANFLDDRRAHRQYDVSCGEISVSRAYIIRQLRNWSAYIYM
jgi:hypothetical protein